MKKLIFCRDKMAYWTTQINTDLDTDLLKDLLIGESEGVLEETLKLTRDKDYDFAGGNLIFLDRTENEVILTYEFEDDGHAFAIKDTELEKIITEWLRLTKSGVTCITIESADDKHFTIAGE